MRFEMVVMTVGNTKEVSILDTEEDNVQLFYCECEEEDLFFIKQEVEQVVRLLNFQNDWIDELIEKNKKLTEKIDEQDITNYFSVEKNQKVYILWSTI